MRGSTSRPGGRRSPGEPVPLRGVASWRRLRLCGDLTYLDGWVSSTAGGRWPVTDFHVTIERSADRQVVHLTGPVTRRFTVTATSHPVHRHLALEMARTIAVAGDRLRATGSSGPTASTGPTGLAGPVEEAGPESRAA